MAAAAPTRCLLRSSWDRKAIRRRRHIICNGGPSRGLPRLLVLIHQSGIPFQGCLPIKKPKLLVCLLAGSISYHADAFQLARSAVSEVGSCSRAQVELHRKYHKEFGRFADVYPVNRCAFEEIRTKVEAGWTTVSPRRRSRRSHRQPLPSGTASSSQKPRQTRNSRTTWMS